MRLALLLCFALGTPVLAQLPNVSFEHLGDRDGLPSRVITCAAEDSSGFMWFGTRRCLARYDGYTFLPVIDGQTQGVAVGRNGLYASVLPSRLYQITHSLSVSSVGGKVESGGYNTFVDSYGHVWYSDYEAVFRFDPQSGKISRYPMTKTTYIFHKGSFVEDSHRTVWVLGMEVGLFRYDRRTDKLLCQMGIDCARPGAEQMLFYSGYIDRADQIWVALTSKGLLRYDTRTGQTTVYHVPGRSISAVCEGTDERGQRILWIGTDTGLGVFRPETGQFAFFEGLLEKTYAVSAIVRSRQTGIVWVCTTEGLLKYDPHNQFVKTVRVGIRAGAPTQPISAALIDLADPTGQTVWLAASRQGLYRWNRTTNERAYFPFPQYAADLEPNWLIQDKANMIWVGCNQWHAGHPDYGSPADNRFEGIFRFDPKAGRFLPPPFTTHHRFFSAPFYSLALFDRRGRLWLANHYESLHVLDPKTGTEINLWPKQAHDGLFANGNWLMDVFEDGRGRIWLSTYQGIFWFDEAARMFRKKAEGAYLDMAEAPDGSLWAVGWHLLTHLDKDGTTLRSWSEKTGLYDFECRRVAVDAQGRVWVGTFDGLLRYDTAKNQFRRFTVNDGLLTNNAMANLTLTPDDQLIVGSAGGWNTLALNAIDKSGTAPAVHLSGVRVNNRSYTADWSKPVRLAPDETAIRFDFSALNYRRPTDIDYEYRLTGFDSTWTDVGHEHQAFYTNLDPGAYVFEARLRGQPVGTLRVPFQIDTIFYETAWFRLLVGLLLLAGIGLVYRSRLSVRTMATELKLEEATRQQREAEFKEEVAAYQLKLSETEMAALRAQMNPHFIFNCLNSIKAFTLENDIEKASDYLTKFSKLIRLVLENSRSERITLDNELATLQLYVDMEAMRFKQKLRYKISVEPGIDVGFIELPPLLLQPYVENAIWHGLMHKPAGGTVVVAVSQPNDDLLTVTITDDGVGRARAAELKSKSANTRRSFGLKMTSDRLALINQLYHTQTSVTINDLTGPTGRVLGTEVVLTIPI